MRKLTILISATLLIISPPAVAQQQVNQIDPVVVSSDKYRVLLENEHVRMVEYQIKPGERDNWHTHPAKASYVVSGGSLKITTEQGESFLVDEEEGSASWFGTVGKHYGENVGKTPVSIVFIEIKAIDAKEEDLTKYKK
jgi:quercetin dioxygenase-like cupin family protein